MKHFFKQAEDEVKHYEKEGYYSGIRSSEAGDGFASLCPKFFLGRKLAYTIVVEEPQQKVKSYIFCCGIKGQVFKVRATGLLDSDFEGPLAKLLTNFSKQMAEQAVPPKSDRAGG